MPIAIFDASKPIEQLLPLNSAWSQNSNQANPNIFTTLAVKQVPKILWLGCSDSRVPETSLLGLNPGEVFTHRNIANLVHPNDSSFPAVLDYAVEHVGVTHIILCGHVGCGGVATCFGPPTTSAPINDWLLPLRAISNNHASMYAGLSTADQGKVLVKLSVQHGINLLRQTKTVSEASGVTVHGAIYDINTGLLSFLEGSDEIEPRGFRANPTDIIRVGTFDTAEVRSTPQTITGKTITFGTPYAKPPRIFTGLTSVDVNCYHDNPRLMVKTSNITATGFQINIDTWGSTIIARAKCTWLEIPDDDDYADFQTGAFATSDDHPWNLARPLTQRQIIFTKPYASTPQVVIWLNGFDSPQDSTCTTNVYASNITNTGFTINHDCLGNYMYGQWSRWLAYPSDTKFGITSGLINVDSTGGSQSVSGTVKYNNLGLSAAPSPVIAGGLSAVKFNGGDSFRAALTLQNPTGSTLDWTATSWGNSSFTSCKGQYIVVPSN